MISIHNWWGSETMIGPDVFKTTNSSDKFKYREAVRISGYVDLKKGNDEIKISADSAEKPILYVDEQGVLITGDGDDTLNAKHIAYKQYSEFTPGIYINGKIKMGAGNDIITGSPLVINGGTALISMGSGNDKILAPFVGAQNSTIDFGSGVDELVLDDGTWTFKETSQNSFSIGNATIKNLERLVNKQGNYIKLREGTFSTKEFDNKAGKSTSQITKPNKFNKQLAIKINNFNSLTDKLEIDTDSFEIDNLASFAIAKNSRALRKLAKKNIDFLYSRKSGYLYFNENGSKKGFGDGGIFAILKGSPKLTKRNLKFIGEAIYAPKKFNRKTADKITNFNPSTDTLEIDTDSFGVESPASFTAGKNIKEVRKLAKKDFDFLYDQKKGGLFFNENGAGKGWGDGGIVAILKGAPDLTSENIDFL